jgi:adenylosuccinate lyase
MVVSEAIQTVLRKINYPQPYEKLKELTRTNEIINQETIHSFIRSLDIDEQTKESP